MKKAFLWTLGALLAIAVVSGSALAALGSASAQAVTPTPTPTASHPWAGILIGSIGPEQLAALGITDRDHAVVILRVVPDSPAAPAGLQPKDVVLSLNGTTITSPDQVVQAINGSSVGAVLTFTVKRGDQTLNIAVTLGEKPTGPDLGGLGDKLPALHGLFPGLDIPALLKGGQELVYTYADAEGVQHILRIVKGTVVSVNEATGSITITPAAGGSNETYTIDENTKVLVGTLTGSLTAFQTGETVVIVTLDGQVKVVARAEALVQGFRGRMKQEIRPMVPRFRGHQGPMRGKGRPELYQRFQNQAPLSPVGPTNVDPGQTLGLPTS